MITIPGTIPVHISGFFWLLAALIGWISTMNVLGTVIWTFIILISVLVHEYGHALTAVAFGQSARIELVGFGGVTHRRGTAKLPFWKDFLIVLNGPIAGLLLSGVAFWANKRFFSGQSESVGAYITLVTYYVNVFWTVVNLLPVQPLDGGKLLSIVLEALFGLKGTKIALFISVLLSAAIGIFFFSRRDYLPGSLFFLFTYESFKSWKESMALTENDRSYLIIHLFKEAEKELHNGNKSEALRKFLRVCESSDAGVLHNNATEQAALLLAQQGDEKRAWELLQELKRPSPEAIALLQTLAFHRGMLQESISYGDKAYRLRPNYDVAITNAMAHSLLRQVSQAVGWINCAANELGHPLGDVLHKKEFDPIRSDPLFRSTVEGNT